MQIKTVRFLANLTNTAGGDSVSEPVGDGFTYTGFAFMDLICSVNSIVGSSGRMTISCNELFSSNYFPTAVSGNITATTTTFSLVNGNANGVSSIYAGPSTNLNPLLGKGMNKQITTNLASGTFSAFNVDVYAVYYQS